MTRLGLLLLLIVSPAFAQEAVSGAVSDSRQPRHIKKCKKFGNCGFQGGYGGFQGGYGGYQGGNGGYPGSPINIAISQSQSSANGADGGYSSGYYPNNHQYNGGYPGYNHGYNHPGYFGNGQGSYNNQFNGNYYGPHGGYGGHQGGYGGYRGGNGGYQGDFGGPHGGYGLQQPIFDEASDNEPQHEDELVNEQGNSLPGSVYDNGNIAGAAVFTYAGGNNH